MKSSRHLAAASGIITVTLLVCGPSTALAFALPDANGGSSSGSSDGGSSEGGTSGTGTDSAANSAGTSSATGAASPSNPTPPGNTSTGSTSTGSTSTSSPSTKSAPSPGSPSSVNSNPLSGMVGQFTHVVGQLNTQLNDTLTRMAEAARGAKPSATPKNNSPAATGNPATGTSATANSTSAAPATAPVTTFSAQSNTPAAASPAVTPTLETFERALLAKVPSLVAQVPLTALDLIKTAVPMITSVIPIPGLQALPVFADALITPLQNTVTGLANAASTLPMFQAGTPTSTATLQATSGHFQRTPAPEVPKPLVPSQDQTSAPPSPSAAAAVEPPTRAPEPEHVFAADNHVVAQPEFRSGYPDYLRAAGIGEVAAVAVPGFTGILTLTAAGGLLGYRQARAGHAASPGRSARFMS